MSRTVAMYGYCATAFEKIAVERGIPIEALMEDVFLYYHGVDRFDDYCYLMKHGVRR